MKLDLLAIQNYTRGVPKALNFSVNIYGLKIIVRAVLQQKSLNQETGLGNRV